MIIATRAREGARCRSGTGDVPDVPDLFSSLSLSLSPPPLPSREGCTPIATPRAPGVIVVTYGVSHKAYYDWVGPRPSGKEEREERERETVEGGGDDRNERGEGGVAHYALLADL